jgi:4-amino-4-deoxychorismate lyase
MEQAGELGLPLAVRNLTLTALQEAEEVFLTNSLIGIWPVRRLDNHAWPRGAVTRQLQERLAGLKGGDVR